MARPDSSVLYHSQIDTEYPTGITSWLMLMGPASAAYNCSDAMSLMSVMGDVDVALSSHMFVLPAG